MIKWLTSGVFFSAFRCTTCLCTWLLLSTTRLYTVWSAPNGDFWCFVVLLHPQNGALVGGGGAASMWTSIATAPWAEEVEEVAGSSDSSCGLPHSKLASSLLIFWYNTVSSFYYIVFPALHKRKEHSRRRQTRYVGWNLRGIKRRLVWLGVCMWCTLIYICVGKNNVSCLKNCAIPKDKQGGIELLP